MRVKFGGIHPPPRRFLDQYCLWGLQGLPSGGLNSQGPACTRIPASGSSRTQVFRDTLGWGGAAGPSGSLGELGVGITAEFGPFPHGGRDKEVGAWPE